MNKTLLHYYRQKRAWQRKLMNDGRAMSTTYADSKKVKLSYASAPYGEHAVSALMSARSHMHFMRRIES